MDSVVLRWSTQAFESISSKVSVDNSLAQWAIFCIQPLHSISLTCTFSTNIIFVCSTVGVGDDGCGGGGRCRRRRGRGAGGSLRGALSICSMWGVLVWGPLYLSPWRYLWYVWKGGAAPYWRDSEKWTSTGVYIFTIKGDHFIHFVQNNSKMCYLTLQPLLIITKGNLNLKFRELRETVIIYILVSNFN